MELIWRAAFADCTLMLYSQFSSLYLLHFSWMWCQYNCSSSPSSSTLCLCYVWLCAGNAGADECWAEASLAWCLWALSRACVFVIFQLCSNHSLTPDLSLCTDEMNLSMALNHLLGIVWWKHCEIKMSSLEAVLQSVNYCNVGQLGQCHVIWKGRLIGE